MIKVDPGFQFLINPLTYAESKLLEENILRDGCRDPMVVWKGKNFWVDHK